MPKHRTTPALAATAALILLGATASTAAPGQWEGPQHIDGKHPVQLVGGVVANANGAFAVWRRGSLRVAHRDPGSGQPWSTPQVLEQSKDFGPYGPFLAIPGGGALKFATVSPAERSYYWRISSSGVPTPRRTFPYRLFTPGTADVDSGRRWLVAGTPQGVPGRVYMAVHSAAGSWRISEPLPIHWYGTLVGAWFDRDGVPHIMAVPAVADTRQASSGRPIYEAKLRLDGSWTQPRQIATTVGGDSAERPSLVANADGDVTLAYEGQVSPTRQATKVKTRPFGGHWSAAVRFREESPSMAIDERGRTFIVRAGNEVFAGRINPLGILDGWEQLTDSTFQNDFIGPMHLTNSRGGVAVVGVVGTLTDMSRIQRYWRCLPGQACERVGDFKARNNAQVDLASGPAGAVYSVSNDAPPCAVLVLCSFRLPAPAPTAQP